MKKLALTNLHVARYQLGELSDIVVRFSESITRLALPHTVGSDPNERTKLEILNFVEIPIHNILA